MSLVGLETFSLYRNWLSSTIPAVLFIGSLLLTFVLTMFTVSFRSLETVTANPVNLLRYE
ncbi:MAG: hypothetical protein PVI11_01900 [Candidatus Aminicenantes bacterium]